MQQSALDLLKLGYDVHVLADGVSSTRAQEVPVALARMRQAGAQIVTSESAAFELQSTTLFTSSCRCACRLCTDRFRGSGRQ